MNNLIESLKAEYYIQVGVAAKANDRIDKIIALLSSLGEGIPVPQDILESEANPLLEATGLNKLYPIEGTVREKIKFLLNIKHNEHTVIELVDRVKKLYEPDADREKLTKAFTQICSNMAAKGEINVEKGYRNKYSYKKK